MKRITTSSDEEILDNLQQWFNRSSRANRKAGKAWYKDAQSFTKRISKKYGIDRDAVAGILSALSPNNKWDRNKYDAEQIIIHHQRGFKTCTGIKVCTYNANKEKAWKIIKEGRSIITAKSPKTHAFAMNVGRLSPKHVTIDKWHIRACLCNPGQGIVPTAETVTPIQYRRVEALTTEIAEEQKMKAYELQAIIWLTIKEAWNR